MEISSTFDFTAPPEVVFNSLTDPDRAGRWLPPGVRLERMSPGRVRIISGAGSVEYEISRAAELGLSWEGAGGPVPSGRAEVRPAPAGGSQVHVRIDAAADDRSRVQQVLDETARRLQRDVSDNFNAG